MLHTQGWTAWVRVWIFHGGYENSMAIALSCSIIVFSSGSVCVCARAYARACVYVCARKHALLSCPITHFSPGDLTACMRHACVGRACVRACVHACMHAYGERVGERALYWRSRLTLARFLVASLPFPPSLFPLSRQSSWAQCCPTPCLPLGWTRFTRVL